MLTNLQLDDNASWKQRFRAPVVLWTQLAKAAPDRGLAVSNKSGKYQLYAWEVSTGELRQLTDRPTGISFGWLAPDGRYVYYLDDKQGNEIGHYIRMPFEGGEPQDLTPDLPLYWRGAAGRLNGFAAGRRRTAAPLCSSGEHCGLCDCLLGDRAAGLL